MRRHHGARRPRHARHRPLIIGLTGSVAMGKSTAAGFLRHLGVPVFDADAAVHQLMGARGRATPQIKKRFPQVVGPRGVDRKALGQLVFGDDHALRDLEAIVHPMVQHDRQQFFRRARMLRRPIVGIDIPLLFESNGERQCDRVMVISAPAFLQRQRVLRRPGMTDSKFAGIRARQMSDVDKRARADVVVPSGLGKRETLRRLVRFLKILRHA